MTRTSINQMNTVIVLHSKLLTLVGPVLNDIPAGPLKHSPAVLRDFCQVV
ncbi:hypothetical protein PS652_05223 [Pseudomonas fluorescens]|uniref:Uncharacterized protein n=1 Tax=Pseudomonas fluorescens TaxID=294 RepID=A0A5E6SXT6_PSEFL|nr:hypothetical protein PS652_02517 [Pseudomonas fluorescens]